jgi:DNA-binding LacI/PurR family transcriptional regulator
VTDNPSGPPAVTIAFIAESAGVSIPTVSKVLNGRSGVSKETRTRVEDLINKYGYRRPSGSRGSTVEIVFREMEGTWAVEVIRGVERVARQNRIGVLVSQLGPDSSPATSIDETIGRRPGCVLFVSEISAPEQAKLKAKDIPFVVINPAGELPDDVPFVGTTNWRGGHSATRHLLDLGHRRIAMINGPDYPFCQARMAGYFSAMAEADVAADSSLVVRTFLTREHGYAAALELLSRPDRPTAIFASNDMQAFGVYRAARELGLSIPGELSVVGFDDLVVSDWADPPLTTVHQPLFEMASAATDLALTLGRGEPVRQVGVEIATVLTVRESAAPPRS